MFIMSRYRDAVTPKIVACATALRFASITYSPELPAWTQSHGTARKAGCHSSYVPWAAFSISVRLDECAPQPDGTSCIRVAFGASQ